MNGDVVLVTFSNAGYPVDYSTDTALHAFVEGDGDLCHGCGEHRDWHTACNSKAKLVEDGPEILCCMQYNWETGIAP